MIMWIWVINTATGAMLLELSKEVLAVIFANAFNFLFRSSPLYILSSEPRH